MSRVIRENRDEPEDLQHRESVVSGERERYGARRVIPPYWPRPEGLPAGDPSSESGAKVAESELDVALVSKVNAAGQVLEVVLTFPDTVVPGTAFNILTGVYAGGGPASAQGDVPPNLGPHVALPPTGADFVEDGRIAVMLNGQDLQRGPGLGSGEAQWVSPSQLALGQTIYPMNEVTVRAPWSPPAPPPV